MIVKIKNVNDLHDIHYQSNNVIYRQTAIYDKVL
jgi:hypothetical protein